jgi:hypothetical protein
MVRTTRHSIVLAILLIAAQSWANKPTIGSKIGGAERSDVYGGVQHPSFRGKSVVKVLRPGIWVKERFHFRDAKTLTAYGKEIEKATAALHGDAKRGDFFKTIVPEISLDSELPGFLFLAPRQGVPFSKLSGAARDTAQKQMKRAFGSARRILGTPVNEDPDNFLFSSSGEVTGWVSFLPQPNGAARPYVRAKKEPLGDGLNTVAYQIKNETPGEGHMTVLKMMWPYSPQRTPVFGTESALRGLSLDIVYSARVLAPKLRSQFGFDVIPDSATHDPGIVVQEMSAGVPMEKLNGGAKTNAQSVGARIVSAAQAAMPNAKFSNVLGHKHFHFDPKTGNPVKGWFDWLSDSQYFWGAERTSFRPKDWKP